LRIVGTFQLQTWAS